MTGVAKNTVAKLLVELGAACSEYQDRAMRSLHCDRVQVDEIWSFVYCKQKTANKLQKEAEAAGEPESLDAIGDVWTWVAMDADTKLVPCCYVGQRTKECARDFMLDLASRISNRAQLTSDVLSSYAGAVFNAFGGYVDYAQVHKVFGKDDSSKQAHTRYSPAVCTGCYKEKILGAPELSKSTTSHVERQNLTMRMSMRRFTRLTNAFSKKVENHAAAISLHFMWYNFGRKHQALKATPAMAAGITNHVWSVEEVVGLLDESN